MSAVAEIVPPVRDADVDVPHAVDVGVAAALIITWSAVQTEQLGRSIRRSGALQRYVRGRCRGA